MSALLIHPAVLAAMAYLAVTLLFQFRPFSTRWLALDGFGIVPRWKFFIPQPGQFDIAIELRGGPSKGAMGEWMPVRLFPARQALTWLWFPEQHRASILWLSAHRLAARARRSGGADAPDSLAYQTLVRHLRRVAKAQGYAIFEFELLLAEAGDRGDRTLFTSQAHAL